MPLPDSRVIHPRWSEHHRPTATAMMPAECVITRATGTGTTDADGKWTPSPPATIYTGKCHATALPTDQGRVEVAGEAQTTSRRYLVGIEHDAPQIRIGDLVEFTTSQDDGMITTGLKVRVTDISYGSEQWQRDLLTEEVQRA